MKSKPEEVTINRYELKSLNVFSLLEPNSKTDRKLVLKVKNRVVNEKMLEVLKALKVNKVRKTVVRCLASTAVQCS